MPRRRHGSCAIAITIWFLLGFAVERPIFRRTGPEGGARRRHPRLHPAPWFPFGRAFSFPSATHAHQVLTPDAKRAQRLRSVSAAVRELAAEALQWEHLHPHQRLAWATCLVADVVPVQELPPFFLAEMNNNWWDLGLDFLSLDCRRACYCAHVDRPVDGHAIVRFVTAAKRLGNVSELVVVTNSASSLTADAQTILKDAGATHRVLQEEEIGRLAAAAIPPRLQGPGPRSPQLRLRRCQQRCLDACNAGARIVEMAWGSGKTRVMSELAKRLGGRSLVVVPTKVLLHQHKPWFPNFTLVGTGHNSNITWNAPGYIAVSKSVYLLKNMSFSNIFIDEVHHPQPQGLPEANHTFRFSATHTNAVDFSYSLAEAIEDDVLCDYDLTVPISDPGNEFEVLADTLVNGRGRFRRVLAFCNSVSSAIEFSEVVAERGLSSWHFDGFTPESERIGILAAFSGRMQSAVHVLATVRVIGEGTNIENADTCMFVEPRASYISAVQAIGRVLRKCPGKPMAHVIMCGASNRANKLESQEALEPASTIAFDEGEVTMNGDEKNESEQWLQIHGVHQQDRIAASELTYGASCARVSGLSVGRFVNFLAFADARLGRELDGGVSRRFRFLTADGEYDLNSHPPPESMDGQPTSTPVARRVSEWSRKCTRLADYVCQSGHLPKVPVPSHASSEERELSMWWSNCKFDVLGKLLTSPQVDALYNVHPLVSSQVERWLAMTPDEVWDSHLNDLIVFIVAHGGMPRMQAKADRKMATWIEDQMRALRQLGPHQKNMLAVAHPYIYKRMLEHGCYLGEARAHVGAIRSFYKKVGRLPRYDSRDYIEHNIASWLLWHRLRKERTELVDAQLATIDPMVAQEVEAWKAERRDRQSHLRAVEAMASMYRARYGRNPDKSCDDKFGKALHECLRASRRAWLSRTTFRVNRRVSRSRCLRLAPREYEFGRQLRARTFRRE